MKIAKTKLQIVPIVGDGAIGHPEIGEGRIIPVLKIDCAKHRSLYDLIVIHEDTLPGDVTAIWGWERKLGMVDKKHAYLTLEFKRPVETTASFCFNVLTQGGLIDWIIIARGVYLQPIESGTIVGLGKAMILVEIASSANLPWWERIYQESLVRQFKHEEYSRIESKVAAIQEIAKRRKFFSMRPKAKTEPGVD